MVKVRNFPLLSLLISTFFFGGEEVGNFPNHIFGILNQYREEKKFKFSILQLGGAVILLGYGFHLPIENCLPVKVYGLLTIGIFVEYFQHHKDAYCQEIYI